jgi:hypothetical protein
MYVDPRIARDWIALQDVQENTPEHEPLFPDLASCTT